MERGKFLNKKCIVIYDKKCAINYDKKCTINYGQIAARSVLLIMARLPQEVYY